MRLILKLLLAQCRRHVFRTLLSLAALATSVAMVIVIVGAQSVTLAQSRALVPQVLGRFDLNVYAGTPDGIAANKRRSGVFAPLPPFNADVLAWIRGHAGIKSLVECGEMKIEVRESGRMFQQPMYSPSELMGASLIGTTAAEPPRALRSGRWLTDAAGNSAVIEGSLAQRLGNQECMEFQITTESGRHTLSIAGVLDAPAAMRARGAVYVTPPLFEQLSGQKCEINRVLIDLEDGVSEEDFGTELERFARERSQPLVVETTEDLQAEAGAGPGMGGGGFFPLLNNAGTHLAILAAMFIIFNTLSMGVQERTRQLAMLRAIGMPRRQVVTLIAVEALALAVLGWLAGVASGWYILHSATARLSQPLAAGIVLPLGLLLKAGALTAFGATFLAAAFPALLASRKHPLEAMQGPTFLQTVSLPAWLPLVAVPLIALNPLAAYAQVFPEPLNSRVLVPLSFVAALIGFVLLLPFLIPLCERVFSGLAGFLFRLNQRLLSRQLSANVWRTVGSVTALTVGLGVFLVVQIWGQSMMVPFLITSRSPDAVATIFPDGVSADQAHAIGGMKGVEAVLPMIIEHPAVVAPASKSFEHDVIYIGCDVPAMIGDRGMIAASFVRGDPAKAYGLLNEGPYCLITDSLRNKAPELFDVGKTIEMDTVEPPARKIRCTIAGVIDMPGWHLLTKSARMRRGMGRVGGLVLVSEPTARTAFPEAQYKTLWLSMAREADPAALEAPLIQLLDPEAKPIRRGRGEGPRGDLGRPPQGSAFGAGPGLFQPMTGRPPRGPDSPGGPRADAPAGPVFDSRYYCRITDTRKMTASIRQRSESIIQALTVYPLLALGLASLAVVSTMMSSIRARMWELGIFRSMGLTRGQLIRQVLAEGLLIGLVACVVSFLFGLLGSWSGIISTSRIFGVTAPYVIPWSKVLLGMASAVSLCVAACLWPALLAALRQPLSLLQDGRSMD